MPSSSFFSQRPSSPPTPTKNTSDALQDALACGHLAAFLSSFQGRVSSGEELLHAYAALEGPGGDEKG